MPERTSLESNATSSLNEVASTIPETEWAMVGHSEV